MLLPHLPCIPILFEHFELALLDKCYLLLLRFDVGYLACKSFVLALKRVCLAVKVFFLLLKSSLLLLQVGTACLFLALELRATFVYFFLCLDESFTFLLSALFMASLIILFASSSALDISRSATFLR